MILEHLKELARRAHNGTSFSPEKRGDSLIKEYSTELEADIAELRAIAEQHGKDPADAIARYKERYIRHFSSWLSSKSNCISSFVVGPAKFPVARAQKYNNREHNKYEYFRAWREKCMKAIVRGFKPRVTPDTELDKARKDLEACEAWQEVMKAANAVIRKAKGADCHDQLLQLGLSSKSIARILAPASYERVGFQQWEITNNGANIRRLKQRVMELERKVTKGKGGEQHVREVYGVRFVENYQEDRIQVFFGRELYLSLKDQIHDLLAGWNFSKANGCCWQRKITPAAKHSANRLFNELQNISDHESDKRTEQNI